MALPYRLRSEGKQTWKVNCTQKEKLGRAHTHTHTLTHTQAPTQRGRDTRRELRGNEHHLVGSRGKRANHQTPKAHSHIRMHMHRYMRIHIRTWHLKQIGSEDKEKKLGDKVLTGSCSKLEEVKILRCFQRSPARRFQTLWLLRTCQSSQQVV
jgi:hypothetical protein